MLFAYKRFPLNTDALGLSEVLKGMKCGGAEVVEKIQTTVIVLVVTAIFAIGSIVLSTC